MHGGVNGRAQRFPARQTLDALKGYGLPEVDYFLEHFLPAFGMTLDEMGRT